MDGVVFHQFDGNAAYAAKYTEETMQSMSKKNRKGRVRIRYDIVKLDRDTESVVISNITFNQLQCYRTMAEKQGTKIW